MMSLNVNSLTDLHIETSTWALQEFFARLATSSLSHTACRLEIEVLLAFLSWFNSLLTFQDSFSYYSSHSPVVIYKTISIQWADARSSGRRTKLSFLRVQIQREPGCEDLPLPEYHTAQSAGLDLYAAVEKETEIAPGEVNLISTGIRLAIPAGYEAQIRPRSGLALHNRIGILNSPGTIDADYRGVVGVILANFGQQPFVVRRGDRIAQMVFSKVERVALEEVRKIKATERGDGGFGHTGTGPPK